MTKQFTGSRKDSRFVLEELEARQLFSGGIEGLIVTETESAIATYLDIDSNVEPGETSAGDASIAGTEQQTHEIAFVDTGIENYQTLVDDLLNNADPGRDIEVVLLDSDRSGIEQISAALQDRDDLDAIHIISHGSDGSVQLGNSSLDAEALTENYLEISLWANAFSDSGDILIYGCNLAASEIGQDLIIELGAMTLADVAASDDLTGHTSLGGDWDLEYQAGEIETTIAVSTKSLTEYQHALANITGTAGDDVLVGGVDDDVITGLGGNDELISGGGSDTLSGGTGQDVFRFTGVQNGDVITVDGGTGTDAIDLTGYNIVNAVFADGKVTIDTGGGFSFEIDYSNIESIQFADVTATVLTGDTSASSFSGSATYIEGDAAFTLDMSGGGNIDWSYVSATNLLSISDTNLTSGLSSIAITSHEGSVFAIDSIASDGVVGTLTTNVDIGQITFSSIDNTRIDNITVNNGAGYIGSITHLGDMALGGTVTMDANVGTFALGPGKDIDSGTFVITGDLRTVDVPNFVGGTVIAERVIGQFDSIADSSYSNNFATPTKVTLDGTTSTEPATNAAGDEIAYPAGNLAGNAGGYGFSGAWTGSSSYQVVGTGLAHPGGGLISSGGAVESNPPFAASPALLERNLSSSLGSVTETVWISFLLQPDEITSPTNSYMGLTIGSGGVGNYNQFAVGYRGNQFQITNWGGGGTTVGFSGAVSGETAFLVMRLDISASGNETATLYLNPSAGLGAPDTAASATKSDLNLGSFATIGIVSGRDGASNLSQLDQVRIGSSYASVAPADNAAVISGDTGYSGNEGDIASGTLAATDAEGLTDGNYFSVTGAATNGNAVIDQASGAWSFTPTDPNWFGSDSFEVTVTDDLGGTTTQLVSITLAAVNDAPVATGNTVIASEDVPLVIGTSDFNFTDTESDALASVTITGLNLNGGTLTHTGGTIPVTNGMTITAAQLADLTFTSALNDSTDSSFTYTVNDADSGVTSAIMNITVNAINDASVAVTDSAVTNEDTSVNINLLTNDSDAEGDPMFVLDVGNPANGTVVNNGDGTVTYTPDANFSGADSFTYLVSDLNGISSYWGLDGNATDSVGGNNGTITGTTTVAGVNGNALSFDKVDDKVVVPNFAINDSFSLSFQIKIDDNSGADYQYIYSHGPVNNPNSLNIFLGETGSGYANMLYTQFNDANDIDDRTALEFDLSSIIGDGLWHTYTLTVETGSGSTVYLDGTLQNSDARGGDSFNPTTDIYLGTREDLDPDRFFGGSLDSVQIFDRALDAGEVSDVHTGGTSLGTVNITVNAVNDAGTFGGATSATTNEDTATAGTVTFADAADGFTTANFSLNTAASNGVAAIDAAGNWTYTPSSNYNGTDSFTVQVTDDDGNVETQVISLTITPINDAGTFGGNTSAITNEDTATAGTVTFADTADGFTTANFSLNTAASNGVAAIDAAGNWTYTPSANYNGADSFTVQVTDDDGNVETQVINITVNAVNDVPVNTVPAAQTVNEDIALVFSAANANQISVGDVDSSSSPLQVTLSSTNGQLTLNQIDGLEFIAGSGTADTTMTFIGTTANINAALDGLSFVPAANFNGAAEIQIQTSDLASEVIGIDSVLGSNTTAGDYDKEQIATQINIGENGTVTSISAYLYIDKTEDIRFGLYSDAAGEPDTLLAESIAASQVAGTNWYTIDIPDTAVIAGDYWIAMDIGKEGAYFYDATGGQTRHSNYDPAVGLEPSWTSTYASNTQSISVYANLTPDGATPLSDSDTIAITIDPVNDAGTFGGNTSATTNEDTATAGTVTFADAADGYTTANFSLNTAASNGVAAIDAAGNWTYTPSANYNGADSFTVQVTDDDGNVETQVISITVTSVNDTGTFGGTTSATTNEDTATAGTVTFADAADGFTTANFSLNTAASNGVAAIDAAGNWTYTPSANYNGADSFTVQVTDDDGNVETQVISLTITPVNDAGTFGGNTSATTNEDTAAAGTVTFADTADGFTTANFSLNTAASNGVAAIDAAGNWTYTPGANYNGSDSFTVQVTDDDGNVETQVISITVTSINDAGSFGGTTSATTNEDTATAGTVTFADTADGFTTANFSLNTAATNGVAAIDAAGNWTYTPGANYNGADSFTVQVTDDDGNVETQVISITVTPINDAGSFGGTTSATTNEDTATAGTVTFADTADGFTTANFSLNTAATNGVAAIDAAGNWTYTPTSNYNGADSFTVQVTDDDGNVETQVISLTITPINDAGTFGGNTSATTNEDTATAGTVTFADTADGFTTANFSLNTAATNGVAAIDAAGNWTYTPSANYNGTDSFTVQVTDDDGNVETQVISLTVTPINDAGSFGGTTSATTNEDTATAGTVTFADTADGFTTANFSLNTAATNGVAAIDAAGNWTYTPGANYNGADSFTVQVTDDDGNVETQVISLTVTPINDAGTFGGNTSATTNEDTATAGTVTFADAADGYTTANFSLNTAASNGVAAIDAAGNWTYTPNSNYNGTDSFTVQVTDDDGNVETRVISLTITPINDAGSFGGTTSATTNEDTATAGTVTFADTADGFTTANFSLNTAATNGVAAIDAAGNWTYTPSANYNGADSFTVQVTDDDGNVETQVISITVTSVNDTGTFGGTTSATTNEDTATAGTVTFADAADGFTTANFSLNTAASNGVAAIDAAGNWTYTPNSNYNGTDSFTVQVTDDDGNVETQVISLTVTPINDTGTFGGNTSATTNEDTATAGTVTFADTADGFTTANFSLNTAASNGVAAIDAAGNWTYTPSANYNGTDSFTVQVTDDDGNVETQVISITVTPINDAGTFGGATSATTNEDTATAGTVTFTDTADGFTTANFSLNTAASNGVAAIDAAGNWTYTPNSNYNGADSFTVQVTDDDGNVETQVISITVTPINDTGTFGGATSATTNEDTATAGTVTFADTADGFTTANFSLNTAASNGVAAIDAAGNWTYTPSANYNGTDSFTVQVTDDDGNVETQVISITVTPINDAGTFGGATSATTNEDTATAGTVTFADTADGFTTANFSLNTAATNGIAAIDAAGNWTYTPNSNYNGTDSFTVQVTDDDGNVETQVISITVTPINDTGTFGGATSATTNEDTATAGTVTFADTADGFTTANFSLNTAASNGVAAIDAAGNWTYTPSANYNGTDSFTVQVTDDDGNVETQVISITVTPINDAGTFGGATSATTNEDTATAGTVTFADTADGFTTANFSLNTAATNGIAAIDAAGNWTYTPNSNYNGTDSFTVQVTDDDGNVETRVISITVASVNDTPVIGGVDTGSVSEDVGVISGNITTSGSLSITDADAGESSFQAGTVAGAYGNLTIDTAGNWTYTAANNQAAIQALDAGESITDTLSVSSFDGSTHSVVITINGNEDTPVFVSTANTLAIENTVYSYTISTSDVDIETLTISASTLPAWLSFVDNGDGSASLSGTPGNAEVGIHNVVLTVSDGTLSSSQVFSITVNNAAPEPAVMPPPIEPFVIENTSDDPAPEPVIIAEVSAGGGDDEIITETEPGGDNITALETGASLNDQSGEVTAVTTTATPERDNTKFNHTPANAKAQELLRLKALQEQQANQSTLNLYKDTAIEIDALEESALWASIDKINRQLDSEAASKPYQQVEVQILAGSTASLTAGFVSWVLRGGSLLASMMSSVPVLNRFDPLPILKSRNDRENITPDDEKDSTESNQLSQEKKVDRLFSRGTVDK